MIHKVQQHAACLAAGHAFHWLLAHTAHVVTSAAGWPLSVCGPDRCIMERVSIALHDGDCGLVTLNTIQNICLHILHVLAYQMQPSEPMMAVCLAGWPLVVTSF